jgi:photosystem II stability/assembly factor-like uncharacterized protein
MRITIIASLLFLHTICFCQVQSEDGPWYAARVRDIAIGYANGVSVIYAVNAGDYSMTPHGTLVKSTDGGDTWQEISTIQNAFSVATRRDNPQIVLVSANGDLLRSSDGGVNWAVVYPGFTASRIAFSRANPNIVLAGTRAPFNGRSIHFSANGGFTWSSDESFTDIANITSIVFHPTDSRCYISGVNYSAQSPNGVWVGAPLTGWGQLLPPEIPNPRIAAFALQESNPQILYAGTISPYGEQLQGENMYDSQPPQIYKSTNAGSDWGTIGNFYASGITIDPTNSMNIIVSSDQGIMRSTNGGNTWFQSGAGAIDRNVLTLTSDASRGGRILAGTLHSFYRSSNGGVTWIERTKGMRKAPTTSVTVHKGRAVACAGRIKQDGLFDSWIGTLHRRQNKVDPWSLTFAKPAPADADAYYWNDVDSHPIQATTIFSVGLFDANYGSIFKSTDDGISWSLSFRVDEPNTALTSLDFDANDPEVVFVGGYDFNNSLLVSLILKTIDSGRNWDILHPGMAELKSLVIDPTTTGSNRVIYVAGQSVRKSKDDGATWYDANASIREAGTLAIDPVHPNILYGGNANGVYKTADGGERWDAINNGIAYRNVTSLLVHPNTPEIVYASSVEGNDVDPIRAHVYRTTNGGQLWTEVSGSEGLPQHAFVYKLRFDDANANTVYVASDSGVYSIPHVWTGQLVANATWKSNQTYLVEGTLSVASDKTLTIESGTTAKFYPTSQLVVDGTLTATGDANAHIALISFEAGQGWKGIRLNGARTNSRIDYADITDATIGIAVSHLTQASITNCDISGAKIGIYIFDSPGPWPLLWTVVRYNHIHKNRIVGISVDKDVSNIVIQDNTLTGNFNDDVGIQFISSSPLEVVRNSVKEFGKHGIQCINASPSFVDGTETGGQSCFVENRIGVYGEASSNFVLGMVEQYNAPGYNTIAYNEESEITLVKECVVYSQYNYHYRRNFNIDESSRLFYDPDLGDDPNRCLDAGNRPTTVGNEPKGGDAPPTLSPFGIFQNPLVMQAIRYRLQRRPVAAIGVLRLLISDNPREVALLRWALHELLANYQLIPNPSGSNFTVRLFTRTIANSW